MSHEAPQPENDELSPPTTVDSGATPAAANDLQTANDALTAQVAELQDAWLRAKAEAENVRRRAQEDVSKAHKFAIEKFAADLLAVKDSLDAALAVEEQTVDTFRTGVELIAKQLIAAFDKNALQEINPVGQKFDPHQHQAISMVPADQDPNTVVSVLQKGYLIAERVLRPALVMVAAPK